MFSDSLTYDDAAHVARLYVYGHSVLDIAGIMDCEPAEVQLAISANAYDY